MSSNLPKSYSKNSKTAKELAKEMEKISQKSQSQISGGDKEQKSVKGEVMPNESNKFVKNVKNVTEKNKVIGMMKSPIQSSTKEPILSAAQSTQQPLSNQVNKSGPHTSLPLYKYKNFRKMHGEEKYILDTHTYPSVQTYIDLLKLNEAEAAEKSLDQFAFNDREFDSTQNASILIHKFTDKPMSKDLADLIDNISFVRAIYICEEPYKHFFYPTKEEEEQHDEGEPIKPPYFTQNFIQGQLQSVHFLNALSLVCSNRELFERMCYLEEEQSLQENFQYGIYAFRFYKNRVQKYTVIIDDKIPCVTLSNGKPVPCFSRSRDFNSLWISLIEKAYAKLNGCYSQLENISLRDAINDLTGLEPEIIPFVDKDYANTQNILPVLNLMIQNKSVVGVMRLGTLSGKGGCWNKSLEGRMYIIKGVDTINKKITVLNCWYNSGLMNGKRYFENQEEAEEEREYEITTEEFFQLFNTFVILKDFNDEYRGLRFDVNLSPSHGLPNANNVSWINNPQLVFDYTDKEETSIIFRVTESKGIEQTNFIYVGFALFSVTDKERQVKQVNFQNMLLNIKSGEKGDYDERYAYGQIKIQKGKYAIIPYSNLKGVDYVLLNLEVFYSCRESVIKFQDKSERILEYCLGEPEESQPRRLRDRIKKERIAQYNIQTSASQTAYEALTPGLAKFFLISSMSTLQQFIRTPENRTFQYLNRRLSVQSVGIQDPLLENFQETLLNEMLLGISDHSEQEEKSERENQKDQNMADQLKYELEGTYDFNHYGLQDYIINIKHYNKRGLDAVVKILVAQKNLIEIKLAGNNISCEGIVNLCYEFEKSHHFELQILDLTENSIGKKGAESLIVFIQRMPKLRTIELEGNNDIPEALLKKINLGLMQKKLQ